MIQPSDHIVNWGSGYATWCQHWPSLGKRRGLPLLVLHGGPGSTHDYLRSLHRLRSAGRDVVLYDQLGNGRSTRLPTHRGDVAFWRPELFVEELANVIEHFGLSGSGYHLLGQSWGGMLAIEWAIEPRAGLTSVILANAPSSMPTWTAEAARLRELLPALVRESLERHEASGTTNHPEYNEAAMEFYRRHFCRLDPWPEDFQASFDFCEEDPTVYETMIGPTEFHVIGTLATWDRDHDLRRITAPVLVLHGEHDEATDLVVAACRREIPGAQYLKVRGASHSPHLEQPETTLGAFTAFLAKHDPRPGDQLAPAAVRLDTPAPLSPTHE